MTERDAQDFLIDRIVAEANEESDALGDRARRPSRLASVGLTALLIVPAVVAIAMGLGLFWFGLTQRRPSWGNFLVTFLGGLVPILLGLYLVRLWRREHGRVEHT